MGITSSRLQALGLVDRVIEEPLGGAHRNVDAIAASLKKNILEYLAKFKEVSPEQLIADRYNRLMAYGINE